MKSNNKYEGFTLTELLIVIVVIAMLFSLMIPIMTKKKSKSTDTVESVWNWITGSNDAYFYPGVRNKTAAAYFGFKPGFMNDGKPHAKVYITTQPNQNHIQFRFGDGEGFQTGLFSMDNKSNIMMYTRPKVNSANFSARGTKNSIMGKGAHSDNGGASSYTVAIGQNTFSHLDNLATYNVAIGAMSGQYVKKLNASNNVTGEVIVGANSLQAKADGTTSDKHFRNTVAIGSRVSASNSDMVNNSVFVGYGVGTGFQDASYSTVIGANSYMPNEYYSTIIGYGAYSAKYGYATAMTAIGAGACNAVSNTDNNYFKTCIGYNSGGTYGMSSTDPSDWEKGDQVFLGGMPHRFNGRAILEIYENRPAATSGASIHNTKWLPRSTTAVVLNSNLVVRGNLYFPDVKNGQLIAHEYAMPAGTSKTVRGGDRCGYKCQKTTGWWARRTCNGFESVSFGVTKSAIGVSSGPAAVVFNAIKTVSISSIIPLDILSGTTLSNIYASGYTRKEEPSTATMMYFDENKDLTCTSPYPGEGEHCPDLKTSDIRLKENITPYDEALEKIVNVIPYKYTFKNDKTNKLQVGVIAQDLQKYMPNSVFKTKDGYLAIKWDEMFFTAINSIKALDTMTKISSIDLFTAEKEIKEIKTNQKLTKNRIAELNKRISKLEKK